MTVIDERAPQPLKVSGRRQIADLVLHLAKRELDSQHRLSLLGWLWPLARQLTQLAVLVFVFSAVFDLGIENFALFVFTGLLIWTWFATSVNAATSVLMSKRHLVLSPRFPAMALPLAAVAVPLADVLLGLPVLGFMLAVEGQLHPTILLLPVLLAIQFALLSGIALIVSVANVYARDVQGIVSVGTLLLFYLTPVFYGLRAVPERFRPLLELNPMAQLVEAARELVIVGRLPAAEPMAYLAAVTIALLASGILLFRRAQGDMVDRL